MEPEGILKASITLDRIMKTSKSARPNEMTFSMIHCFLDFHSSFWPELPDLFERDEESLDEEARLAIEEF